MYNNNQYNDVYLRQLQDTKDKIEEIEYQGNNTAVLNKKSFYTVLSYGFSSKVVGKALKGDLNLDGDVMTDTVLGLLLNDKIN